jgi:hypothetical protein
MSEAFDVSTEQSSLDREYQGLELLRARQTIEELKKSNSRILWVAVGLFLVMMWLNTGTRTVKDEIEEKLSAILNRWDDGAPVSEIKEDLNALDEELQPPPPDDNEPY